MLKLLDDWFRLPNSVFVDLLFIFMFFFLENFNCWSVICFLRLASLSLEEWIFCRFKLLMIKEIGSYMYLVFMILVFN